MPKQPKNFNVFLEKSREWLARYESGETLKYIAHVDQRDIRTVKKQVQEATEDRLSKEVRQSVLRAALEKHFSDFIALADRLRNLVSTSTPLVLEQDNGPLLEGLQQHMPRSLLWEYLDSYQKRLIKSGALDNWVKKQLVIAPKLDPESIKRLGNRLFDLKESDNTDHLIDSESPRKASSERINIIHLNPEYVFLGTPPENLIAANEMLLAPRKARPIPKNNAEMERLQSQIHMELTAIILRRVVPGHCFYCPL